VGAHRAHWRLCVDRPRSRRRLPAAA
jgi:hypothetical protein